MDAPARYPDQLVFHLTGRHHGEGLSPIEGLGLRPALLAPYRDLESLRHDFPVVLSDQPSDPEFVRSLTGLVDAMLVEVAPRGVEGERLRRHALQLEREIRTAVANGASGTVGELWDAAAERLGAGRGPDEEPVLEKVLRQAGGALPVDGEVLGCTHELPARLLTHAWEAARRAKAKAFHLELSRLVIKLSDILRAAFSHSQAGRQPKSLEAAVGGPHRDAFDFDVLSRIVGKGVPRDELPPSRRERLVRTLGVLEGQRFFPASDDATADGRLDFRFDDCRAAALAFRERLADLAALVKALEVAELEVTGKYVESEHDLYFEAFDAYALTADDLARFPDYLVCIPSDRNDAPENANLMEMLSSGLPVKVLVQTTDLLEDASIGTGHFAFGVRSARLATTAMGLGGMFVLQSPSSNLYALRHRIARALACPGPALVSVYAASPHGAGSLAPYLGAAAAMQSRSFPAFSYDAGAGLNWATRFSLENNPQPDDDWPVEPIEYVDRAMQRAGERWAFTYADFALCDPRHAGHFALVPPDRWNASMLPVADWLALDERDAAARIPYLLAVDRDDALQRVIVDARLMAAVRRCLLLWRRLQEHGGVHDSHAERLLAAERAANAVAAAAAPAPAPAATVASASAATPAAADTAAPEAPTRSRDEAWIETARCPSCNECQLVNDRMFGYDERKQAFIKDLAAGTYRQLVEAAESCQVAII
ncbi:MAG: hypothetical protein ABI641_12485, partial [Caldimonas sp.]